MLNKSIKRYAVCMTVFVLFFLSGLSQVRGQTGFIPSDTGTKPQEPFKINVSAVPDAIAAGSTGTVQVVFDIASGYKIYADTVSVSPGAVEGFTFGKLRTPRALEKKEPDGNTALFYQGYTVFELPVRADPALKPSGKSIPLEISFRGCSETVCFLPEKRQMEIMLAVLPPLSGDMSAERNSPVTAEGGAAGQNETEVHSGNAFRNAASEFGLAGVLTAAFLWGLLASLTPCVYPMIPVTVSVIGAGRSKNLFQSFLLSLFYVLGMSLTYAVFGVVAAWSGSLFGAYTDHPAVRILVSGIFVILALGMFDLVHIRMPSRISSRLGAWTGSGFFGVFITGAATGAVVGPCVGPMLVGLLVYVAGLGDALMGFLLLWSFSLGMGMLFLVIGTFSGLAASLPRSGEWMVSLRRFFGFLMLGAALYYVHPLLPEEAVLLLAGLLLTAAGVSGGALTMGEPVAGWRVFFKSLALVCLMLGLACAARVAWVFPLKGAENRIMSLSGEPSSGTVADSSTGPAISWFAAEDKALEAARTTGRPILVDFRADWCAACRKLEAETFPDARVAALIRDGFVAFRIDGTRRDDPVAAGLQKKYGVVGLPTLLFLTPDGRRIPGHDLTRFVPPGELIEHLTAVIQQHGVRPAKP